MGCCPDPNDDIPAAKPNFTLKWQNDYGKNIQVSPIPGIIKEDIVWVQLDSNFHIINMKSGEITFTVESDLDHWLDGSRNMILEDNRIYIHITNWIRCYDFNTGKLIWNTTINDPVAQIATEMHMYGDQLYIPKRNGCYIVDKFTGSIVDEIKLTEIISLELTPRWVVVRDLYKIDESTVVFAIEGQDSNFPLSGGYVASIDLNSKAENWRIQSVIDTTSGGTIFSPSPSKMDFWGDHLAYIGSDVYVVNKFTGEEIWKKDFDNLGFFFGLEVSDDGILYLGSTAWDRVVMALDIKTGEELWYNKLQQASIEYLKVKDDFLFVLAEHLVILNRHTGKVLFDFVGDTEDLFYDPPIIGDDHFIGISSQRVYCWSYE